jgi:hypothetical protein
MEIPKIMENDGSTGILYLNLPFGMREIAKKVCPIKWNADYKVWYVDMKWTTQKQMHDLLELENFDLQKKCTTYIHVPKYCTLGKLGSKFSGIRLKKSAIAQFPETVQPKQSSKPSILSSKHSDVCFFVKK